ncbi:MAG: PQQ-binding-like beta-propeller repeat protein [Pseudomonadota bacterium]
MRAARAVLILALLTAGCGRPATDSLITHPEGSSVVWGRMIQTPNWFAEYARNLAPVLPVPGRPVAIVGTSSRPTGALLEAFRTDDGSVLWRKQMPGAVEAAGVIAGDSLYLGTGNGSVHRIHLPSGQDLWEPAVQVPSGVSTTPLLLEDPPLLVIRDAADRLTALSSHDGAERWTHGRPLPLGGPSLQGAPDPVLIGGGIIVGFADGTVESLEPTTGKVRWSRRLCSDRRKMNDADMTPLELPDGSILVGCHSRGIATLAVVDGEVLQTFLVPGPLHAVLDLDRIWLTTTNGRLLALNANTLEVVWELELGETPLAGVQRCGGVLLVPIDRSMMMIDPRDGLALGELATGYGLSAAAACVDGDLLSLTDGGVLYRTRLLQ